ncbi:MAG TPA: succinate dehydrogenase cytochrome b subunit [Bacteroidia bacterium]|nr:succinate dehydrogenase cytochrome b subunit [Sphingobacteriales bacterium]HPD66080.1 succinate dehydrogenase cytochrome b subunit [Bacteroidia bacterium]HRS58047.1 succinate dehydrogenase cytochrome b subunit [Bacteroidia bacterium]HRU66935.1 succinate dehydrogenase cytochrome b subunit [Bacteroidia bacterium]
MSWFITAINSSIGKKLIMSFAGLFLIAFLLVHLGINLLVLLENNTYFNVAAHFMATNWVIKVFEVILFLGFLIHIIYALILQIQNWMARPVRYKIENLTSQTSFFSKYMIHTAVIILIFLVLHLFDFYLRSKLFEELPIDKISGKPDMAAWVEAEFKETSAVIIYVVSFLFLAFHLNHAFQSAFQTLGLNHNKWTPVIKFLGLLYSILVPAGFAFISLYIYFS